MADTWTFFGGIYYREKRGYLSKIPKYIYILWSTILGVSAFPAPLKYPPLVVLFVGNCHECEFDKYAILFHPTVPFYDCNCESNR